MKSTILYLFFLLCLNTLQAQFQSADLGISGLTCSACSRGVEMSLRKLPFVENVIMNLQLTQAKIIFKKSGVVEIEKLAAAVIDAGFSLNYLKAEFLFSNIVVSNNYCFSFENNKYQFLLSENKTLNGKVILRFIGDKYLPKKDVAAWKPKMNKACQSTNKKEKLYYVTL
ncbi:MAG: heavy-metal-associated domain-containing protein [Flavobacteriales bacterium]